MLDAVNVGDRNRVLGVVEFDRSGSGASDRVDQSTALSCVYERIHSRHGLRGVRVGEASHPGPDCCADILEEPAESMTIHPMKSH